MEGAAAIFKLRTHGEMRREIPLFTLMQGESAHVSNFGR